MLRFLSSKVSVEFIDQATGGQIARLEMPVAQLPDTFVIDTKLDLAGAHYVVAHADPETKPEFANTRRLRVTVRKVELVDPKTILFSLPTISGAALPRTASGGAPGIVCILHEDDWRQCEFIATDHHREITAEFASIRHIHVAAAAEIGWREIHVRERIARPLSNGTRWAEITALLGEFERVSIAFGDATKPVLGGTAARLPGDVILWGVEEAGELTVLCVEKLGTASEATIASLKRIADSFSLALIDWCRLRAYASNDVPIANATGSPWDGAE